MRNTRPLADLIRPKTFADLVGHSDVLSEQGLIGRMVKDNTYRSFVMWGPPGIGKTTIARLIGNKDSSAYREVSAVYSTVSELKKIFADVKVANSQNHSNTLLFVDEIHRFNKAQQDAFLPVIENGTIILIGSTTENPSFALNSALLSRLSIAVLNRLNRSELIKIIDIVEKKTGNKIPLSSAGLDAVINFADGDGRRLVNILELMIGHKALIDDKMVEELLQKKVIYHDRKGDLHYNLISALHKSIRGSDCDAALYWLSRLLSAGEDQNFILRRLTRISIEDIGLADPSAVRVCLDCWNVFRNLGAQEGDLAIAQAVIYLSLAPKSISSYVAFKSAMKTAKSNDSFLPPSHLISSKHPRMLELGFGENYEYDPEFAESFSGQNYFPDQLKPIEFYKPVDRGFERDMNKRLRYYSTLRKKIGDKKAK